MLPARSSAADVVAHYQAEREARQGQPLSVIDSFASRPDDPAGFAVVIASETWETADGLNFVHFEPPVDLLARADRDEVFGPGISENGVLVREGVPAEGINGLSMGMRDKGEGTNKWQELQTKYRKAYDAGRTGWVGYEMLS